MITVKLDTRKAHRKLMQAGVELCRDSAGHAQDVALSEAREDTGEMKARTIVVDTPNGGELQANAPHSVFEEFGVGIGNERGGRSTPWKYQRADGAWITTSGHKGKAFMRPGYAAGTAYFRREAKRRGM